MQVVLVFATPHESRPLFTDGKHHMKGGVKLLNIGGKDVTLVYSGIGSMSTAYELGRLFINHHFDLAINAGICGSFDRELSPGTVVNIESDCFADLGAEDDDKLLSVFDIGLMALNEFPLIDGKIHADKCPATERLKKANAITVNTTTGSEVTIERMKRKYDPDVESMEGAAFFYACRMNNIPCIQIRAVSNYVEKRNRDSWQIDLALENLAVSLKSIIAEL